MSFGGGAAKRGEIATAKAVKNLSSWNTNLGENGRLLLLRVDGIIKRFTPPALMKTKHIVTIAQAVLTICLLSLGCEKAAAQTDPVLKHPSNDTDKELRCTIPCEGCTDGGGEGF
jgi:hypothetical protein